MVKHQAWATTVVTTISLGSMTTKGDEANLQGEFNSVPGLREQLQQCRLIYGCIQFSNRPDLPKKSQKKNITVLTHH